MMLSSPDDLELLLVDTGTRLADHSIPDNELVSLLELAGKSLTTVEQSPVLALYKSMSETLTSLMKALVEDASCISQIMSIKAPNAPLDDDPMKDVFQLIVSSFADLSKESKLYTKRVSILEAMAKVRSCLAMLVKLECDWLIAQLFEHFLKARDDQPDNVFSSMETIMTIVIKESKNLSLELLTLLLATLKKENSSKRAQDLGENILRKAAKKLQPYLEQAVNSMAVSLADYSLVVTLIFNGTSCGIVKNDDNVQPADKSQPTTASSVGTSGCNCCSCLG